MITLTRTRLSIEILMYPEANNTRWSQTFL